MCNLFSLFTELKLLLFGCLSSCKITFDHMKVDEVRYLSIEGYNDFVNLVFDDYEPGIKDPELDIVSSFYSRFPAKFPRPALEVPTLDSCPAHRHTKASTRLPSA